jgi:hypothetical protein
MKTKVPPANPPIWAAGWNAACTMVPRVAGISATLNASTMSPAPTYSAAMNGTSFEVTRPMRLIPPGSPPQPATP